MALTPPKAFIERPFLFFSTSLMTTEKGVYKNDSHSDTSAPSETSKHTLEHQEKIKKLAKTAAQVSHKKVHGNKPQFPDFGFGIKLSYLRTSQIAFFP